LSLWLLLVIWSAATYRVTRLIVLDTLIEEPRDKVMDWLERYKGERRPAWKQKLSELLGCPYCVSAYVSAGVLVAHRVIVGSFPVPVWFWLAVWTGGLVIYAYIDSE
jgi:hypothetical protein